MNPFFMILLALFVGNCLSAEIKGCKVSVIGGGWGGFYFGWRLAIDTNAFDPSEICIFEASTTRIGGRVYSVAGVAELEGQIVDVGAYRYSIYQEIIKGLVEYKLGLPHKCYDPDDCSYQIIADKQGNNAGFLKGPQTMQAQLTSNGGRPVYMGHRLTKIESGTSSGTTKLTFSNGDFVHADITFLNIPSSALNKLDETSIIWTETDATTRRYLLAPIHYSNVKVYVVYRDAWWVSILGLTTGIFRYDSPPIEGRYYDGPVTCKPPPVPQDANYTEWAPCMGALLVFYNYDLPSGIEFYIRYRDTPSDPLTLLKPGTDKNGQLLKDIHTALMNLHRSQLLAAGVDPDSIAPPELGLIGGWDDSFTDLYPGTYYFPPEDNQTPIYVIKPLPNYNIYIGNEAWSCDNGWAEGSLVLTERVIYHHIHLKPPSWILPSYYNSKVINQNDFHTEMEKNLEH